MAELYLQSSIHHHDIQLVGLEGERHDAHSQAKYRNALIYNKKSRTGESVPKHLMTIHHHNKLCGIQNREDYLRTSSESI